MSSSLLLQPNTQSDHDQQSHEAIETVLCDPAAWRQFQKGGLFGLGEAYMDGLWESDHLDQFLFERFTEPANRLSTTTRGRMFLAAWLPKLFDRQAGDRAFRIGQFHYDLGNDLFETMLDQSMTYTSGYWAESEDIDSAQEAKLDLLCRKLDLQSGIRVLDIGCGWGNFAHHAAHHHGVEVTGITVSGEQADVARERCSGLPVDIQVMDYRDLSDTFDRVVSIEMIEAVGRRNVPRFFDVVNRSLEDDGLFGLQVISGDMLSRTSNPRMDQFVLWLLKYIFPDGYLPHDDELKKPSGTDLCVLDWHRFSQDYDRTLLAWAERFNDGWSSLSERYGERFRRQWNYYLNGCASAFRAGHINVQQVVYAKSGGRPDYQPIR